MTTRKVPGMVQDPWRRQAPAIPEAPPLPPVAPIATVPSPRAEDAAEEDFEDAKYATLELKGYGGITVSGTRELPSAAVRILNFCVDHRQEIEPLLTDYGVIIAQLPVQRHDPIKLHIQRRDGWMLAVPLAKTRDEGALQLIQAFLQIQATPALRKKLEVYNIRPYKM